MPFQSCRYVLLGIHPTGSGSRVAGGGCYCQSATLPTAPPKSAIRFREGVWGLGYGVWGLRFGVWCVVLGVWSFKSRVEASGFKEFRELRDKRSRFSVCGFRVSGFDFGFRVSGFGFRVSGFGFWISDFGFRVLGFRSRVSVFGFRDSGFGVRNDCQRAALSATPAKSAPSTTPPPPREYGSCIRIQGV